MAKKSKKNQPERNFDPRFDDPSDYGLDDPFAVQAAVPDPEERAPYSAKGKQPKPIPSRSSGGCLSLIGGFFQVLINGLLLFLLFGALGFVIVYGARALGVIQPAAPAVVPTLPPLQIAAAPTPTPVGEDTTVSSDGGGAMTEIIVCDSGIWWESVAGDFDTVLTAFALAFYAPVQPVAEVVAAAQTSRDNAANQPFDDCLLGTRQTLIDALDAQMDALRTLEAGDRPTAFARSQEAAAQFASVLDGLWEQGIDTGEGSAVSAGIPRGGDTLDCAGLGEWFAQLQPQIVAFTTTVVPAVDFLEAHPDDIARARGETVTISGNLRTLSAPACAAVAQQAAQNTVDYFFAAVDSTFSGNRSGAVEPAMNYARSAVLLDVWLRWVGLTAG
ncbi:MAG: hypothetical protein IAE89_02155 [Anaerolineae bacterium]|nr:hypothetical protein [Anaerolineae bacterium]